MHHQGHFLCQKNLNYSFCPEFSWSLNGPSFFCLDKSLSIPQDSAQRPLLPPKSVIPHWFFPSCNSEECWILNQHTYCWFIYLCWSIWFLSFRGRSRDTERYPVLWLTSQGPTAAGLEQGKRQEMHISSTGLMGTQLLELSSVSSQGMHC